MDVLVLAGDRGRVTPVKPVGGLRTQLNLNDAPTNEACMIDGDVMPRFTVDVNALYECVLGARGVRLNTHRSTRSDVKLCGAKSGLVITYSADPAVSG